MPTELIGLILTGGKSTRMGIDKSLLPYMGTPQWLRVRQLLQPYCKKVLISCQRQQSSLYPGMEILPDADDLLGIGPMAGILSAFREFPDSAILAVGCDYPFLSALEIEPLIHSMNGVAQAVCYRNADTGWDEPFPAIYHSSIRQHMQKEFGEGHFSLRQLLRIAVTVRLECKHPEALKSINTAEEYEWACQRLSR